MQMESWIKIRGAGREQALQKEIENLEKTGEESKIMIINQEQKIKEFQTCIQCLEAKATEEQMVNKDVENMENKAKLVIANQENEVKDAKVNKRELNMMDAKKEHTLQKEAEKMKKRIRENKTRITYQARKIMDAQDYIRDLTTELERVYNLTSPKTNAESQQEEKI